MLLCSKSDQNQEIDSAVKIVSIEGFRKKQISLLGQNYGAVTLFSEDRIGQLVVLLG